MAPGWMINRASSRMRNWLSAYSDSGNEPLTAGWSRPEVRLSSNKTYCLALRDSGDLCGHPRKMETDLVLTGFESSRGQETRTKTDLLSVKGLWRCHVQLQQRKRTTDLLGVTNFESS